MVAEVIWNNEKHCFEKAAPEPSPMELGLKQRRIETRLVGSKATEVLKSVIGQMSDGKWENTPGYDRYWRHCDIDPYDNSIIVDDWYNSGFKDKTDQQVRDFFARKIKALLKDFYTYGEEWETRENRDEWKHLSDEEYEVYRQECLEHYGRSHCGYLQYYETIPCAYCEAIARLLRTYQKALEVA